MEFKDLLKQLANKVESLKNNLKTEEATKTALIMPFLQALGYDVFNPLEILPEFICDIGIKQGEKIDYAILKDNKPVILIECKHCKQDLNLHDNQLLRYFNISNAKFGVLTNGIVYRFYTDLDTQNRMDKKPFLEINLSDLKEHDIEELKKFHKSYFDVEKILNSASELKYLKKLKARLSAEFANPSTEFVKFVSKNIYNGTFSPKIIDQFTSLVKRSISSCVNDIVSEQLKETIENGNENSPQQTKETSEVEKTQTKQIKTVETTAIKLNGYYIVKSILRTVIPVERIVYSDNQGYFAVNIDNLWYNVCRLYFNNPANLRIMLKPDNKIISMSSLDDIYKYSEQLIETAKKILMTI
ncbi:MAG: type I restriction enzyme HsdR N-terminal domain-containing protein [Prevotellaceae bacterium]|jgi:hypothetical protein|nr:type I restriction enzyme HsdR N-terminal domain-containing protein [Prevotellaceae bacterium]